MRIDLVIRRIEIAKREEEMYKKALNEKIKCFGLEFSRVEKGEIILKKICFEVEDE